MHQTRPAVYGLAVALALFAAVPAAAVNSDGDAMDACTKQLEQIARALAAYEKDHGKLPDQLSDLVPQYVNGPKLFHCPADATKGETGRGFLHKDPKLAISYAYEFSADESHGLPTPLGSFPKPDVGNSWGTCRLVGERQRYFFGDQVPTVRCFHHKGEFEDVPKVLNLARDGRVYRSTGQWENHPDSVRNVLEHCARDLKAGAGTFEQQWNIGRLREYLWDKGAEPQYKEIRPQFAAFADALASTAKDLPEQHPQTAYRIAANCYNGAGEYQKAMDAVEHSMRLALEHGNYPPVKSTSDGVACEQDILQLADACRGLGRRGEEAALLLLLHAHRPTVGYFNERLADVHEAVGQKAIADRYHQLNDPGRRLVGKPAPDFSLPSATAQGQTLALNDLRRGRKAVLVNFWFAGCGPCRAEFPHLQKMYTELKDKGLEVVAIDMGDSRDEIGKVIAKDHLTFPVAVGGQPPEGDPANVFARYGVQLYPTNFLLNADGQIVWHSAGFEGDGLPELRAELAKLGVK